MMYESESSEWEHNAGRDVYRYIRQILYNIQNQPWSVKLAA